MSVIEIREAVAGDVGVVLNCIRGLAGHVGLADTVSATEDQLRASLFGGDGHVQVRIAYLDGVAAGYVLFFKTYSTFKARAGLYIEDLFVFEEFRGMGIGRELIEYVFEFGRSGGYNDVQWYVNNENAGAIGFYEKMNAKKVGHKSIYCFEL